MSDTELADEPILASCSFCRKSNREVQKLVAGPGVYICNECVALCDQLVAEESTAEESAGRRDHFVNRSPEELLTMLPALARTAAEVEADLRRRVLQLRTLGTGWEQIAAALDLSAADAQQRFEPAVDR